MSIRLGLALAVLIGTVGGPVVAQKPASTPTNASQTPKPPAAAPKQATPTPPGPTPWWSNEAIKKELGLTAEQAKAISDIYTTSKDELAAYNDAANRERNELDRMIDESKVERWVVARQIDKLETQSSAARKLRLMILYRMHQVLTPEQRKKLTAIQERDRKDPRKHL